MSLRNSLSSPSCNFSRGTSRVAHSCPRKNRRRCIVKSLLSPVLVVVVSEGELLPRNQCVSQRHTRSLRLSLSVSTRRRELSRDVGELSTSRDVDGDDVIRSTWNLSGANGRCESHLARGRDELSELMMMRAFSETMEQ